jgi:hypothetical protein
MKFPISFEQFKSDPLKALLLISFSAMSVLYYRAEAQSKEINQRCEERLLLCEAKLDKLSKALKTQDSLCSALITEITIYKSLARYEVPFSIIITRTYNGFIYEAYINRRACRRANTTKRNFARYGNDFAERVARQERFTNRQILSHKWKITS